ncbi:MAG: alpha/beta fold hydrolase [Solirubrobacteraceae bacterium]|nr:alpha/beta fold hydrolase [Solirubrobacteraceae bacterium]
MTSSPRRTSAATHPDDALGAASAPPRDHAGWIDVDWRAHLRWVRVKDRPVNVLDIGEGPAIVFLHGLSGCWQNWLESIPPLAADHRVIAIDLPGFGESPMPAEPITVSGYARLVVELLDALGVQRATIVGNSMGGFVGCELAIRFPARVQRLVLVAAAGLSLRHMRHERKRGLRARIENLLFFGLGLLARHTDLVVRSPHLRRGLLLLIVAHPERLSGPLILEQAHGAGKPGFDDALDAMTAYPIRDRLGEIACPTLIVWGQEDRLVPVRDAAEFAWLIPDARKLVYADSGHMVMLEHPARFNADVRAFIDA